MGSLLISTTRYTLFGSIFITLLKERVFIVHHVVNRSALAYHLDRKNHLKDIGMCWMSARTVQFYLQSNFKKIWALVVYDSYLASLVCASWNSTCSSFTNFYHTSVLILSWKLCAIELCCDQTIKKRSSQVGEFVPVMNRADGIKRTWSTMDFGQLLLLLLFAGFHKAFVHGTWTFKCPCHCDFDDVGRKRVTCTGGRLKDVPIRDMDTKTQVTLDNLSCSCEPLNMFCRF